MSGGVESLGRVRRQGLLLLAAAFGVGMLVGIGVDRLLLERPPTPPWGMRTPALGPGELPPFFEDLGLTDGQRARIRTILQASRPAMDSVLRGSLPRMRALTDSVQAEIDAVLTPAQRARLREIAPPRRPFPDPPLRRRAPPDS